MSGENAEKGKSAAEALRSKPNPNDFTQKRFPLPFGSSPLTLVAKETRL
jgi:hypothetical protein